MNWLCLFALVLALPACSQTDDGEPREFSGVWLYEFEGSTFVEGATEVPKERPASNQSAWLNYHPDPNPDRHPDFPNVRFSRYDDYDEARDCYLVHPFLVTFVGRRATDQYGSGHMGLWGSEVKVDRMILSRAPRPTVLLRQVIVRNGRACMIVARASSNRWR